MRTQKRTLGRKRHPCRGHPIPRPRRTSAAPGLSSGTAAVLTPRLSDLVVIDLSARELKRLPFKNSLCTSHLRQALAQSADLACGRADGSVRKRATSYGGKSTFNAASVFWETTPLPNSVLRAAIRHTVWKPLESGLWQFPELSVRNG